MVCYKKMSYVREKGFLTINSNYSIVRRLCKPFNIPFSFLSTSVTNYSRQIADNN
jgi:hypothetical protein